MIQRGQKTVAWGSFDRLWPLIYLKFELLRAEVAVGSEQLAAVGLVSLSLALQTIVLRSPGHFRPAGVGAIAVLIALGTLGSLVLAGMAAAPLRTLMRREARGAVGLAGLIALAILSVVGAFQVAGGIGQMAQGTPYNNDGAVMDLYAARQVLHGHNPYENISIVAALANMDAPSTTTTPLMRGQFGAADARAYPSAEAVQQVFMNVLRHRPRTIPPEFESKYNYPSGSFLFILPFVWAGLHDMRFLYILAVLAMGAYLWQQMPRSLRFVVPALLLADVPLVVLTMGGQPDPLYGLFLLIGLAEWRRSRVSPLAVGLAVATKQLAWFFLPAYLVLIACRCGIREAVRRLALVTGVFLLFNAPFIALSPRGYLTSIAGPMSDPMFPLGIGIVAIFLSNVLPLLPKAGFTVLELAAWAGSTAAFARLKATSPALVGVLGVLPLFFAWRSLVNYFYLAPFFVLAVYLAGRKARSGVDGGVLDARGAAVEPVQPV